MNEREIDLKLADRIEKRIREIPASNPGVVSFTESVLRNVLSRDLIRRIAEEAAKEIEKKDLTASE